MTHAPAQFSDDYWIWRWVYTAQGVVLHRVASPFDPTGMNAADPFEARTVCGMQRVLWVPGVMSRMGALRCRRCCRATGIDKDGFGSPYNEGIRE